ncbi:MAG: Fic family protein [Nitrosopumilus sp.]|nr:Fic family protein [Nitrosopumilus sp.]MDH3736087.1 Fic family protein [Nitrosopumilus sp.]MDH3822462.1 Fic family protein [Nitrosopumilus sp.]MDH3832910.1 Fic family protein [Nitrosopumilus sp.]
MVSIVKERGFYYLKHHIQGKERRKYLGKIIPKNIEDLKKAFLRQFYCEDWDEKIQSIGKKYQKEIEKTSQSIQLKNFESFGIAFTYNTQKIEGSSLTKTDTKDLLVFGVTPTKKSQIDTIETKKHYELFMRLVTSEKIPRLTKKIILQWHKEIFDQTKIGEAGTLRSYRVGVTTNEKIDFTPVVEIPKKLAEFFNWLGKYDGKKNVVEFACMAHYKFVSIHPFGDGNGRISRLIMNYILFKHRYPLMLIKSIDRRPYFKSLEKSQLNHDEIHFLKWFMKYYLKENKRYL